MMALRMQKIILSPGFVTGLFLLLLNDFYLKTAFPGLITGKLSDFAGLFTFPLFICSLISKRTRQSVYVFTGLAFVLWKSSYATDFIRWWNATTLIAIGRTIDYSDLFALFVLPLSYWYLLRRSEDNVASKIPRRNLSIAALLLSIFAFTATTRVRDRSIHIAGDYSIINKHQEIEAILRENDRIGNMKIRRHDDVFNSNDYPNYPKEDLDPTVYFVDFTVDEETCDSRRTNGSFILREKDSHSELFGIEFSFECGEYERVENYNSLNVAYEAKLKDLFQREVLSKIKLYKENDKTPRP